MTHLPCSKQGACAVLYSLMSHESSSASCRSRQNQNYLSGLHLHLVCQSELANFRISLTQRPPARTLRTHASQSHGYSATSRVVAGARHATRHVSVKVHDGHGIEGSRKGGGERRTEGRNRAMESGTRELAGDVGRRPRRSCGPRVAHAIKVMVVDFYLRRTPSTSTPRGIMDEMKPVARVGKSCDSSCEVPLLCSTRPSSRSPYLHKIGNRAWHKAARAPEIRSRRANDQQALQTSNQARIS